MKAPVPASIRRAWARTRPFHAPIALVGGIAWDELTMRRIDRLRDNLSLLAYLVALGALILLELRRESGRWVPRIYRRVGEWGPLGVQFLFGGLYSAYAVYYAKSTTGAGTLLFIGFLLILVVANEYAARHLRNEWARIGLYGFCVYSFLLFFLPNVTHVLTGNTVAAAVLAFATCGCISLASLVPMPLGRLIWAALARTVATAVVLLVLLAAAWFDWIPPVPLGMRHAGIYHHVERAADGTYVVRWEPRPGIASWFFADDRVFYLRDGDSAWCFSQVFAPRDMEVGLVHHWQRWVDGSWLESDAIPVQISGGRESGYRTFTRKSKLVPGSWRVVVTTDDGRELGRVPFTVVASTGPARQVERHLE